MNGLNTFRLIHRSGDRMLIIHTIDDEVLTQYCNAIGMNGKKGVIEIVDGKLICKVDDKKIEHDVDTVTQELIRFDLSANTEVRDMLSFDIIADLPLSGVITDKVAVNVGLNHMLQVIPGPIGSQILVDGVGCIKLNNVIYGIVGRLCHPAMGFLKHVPNQSARVYNTQSDVFSTVFGSPNSANTQQPQSACDCEPPPPLGNRVSQS